MFNIAIIYFLVFALLAAHLLIISSRNNLCILIAFIVSSSIVVSMYFILFRTGTYDLSFFREAIGSFNNIPEDPLNQNSLIKTLTLIIIFAISFSLSDLLAHHLLKFYKDYGENRYTYIVYKIIFIIFNGSFTFFYLSVICSTLNCFYAMDESVLSSFFIWVRGLIYLL